ncbi:hypothetical protein TpMuguga_04g00775 [Theileria parva strain Muguga]|uniref:uncharacterized protein n=1 Tax=Theileria parva strain Muguga TaxID=333668 RepID=UPI001C62025D|nr:uncharacterized protein TpMuguga_04g00775 [Theileria parva strain Muguga]EAN32128.2 hypothetical protein TpMuguga_04g00775 [Theileria parva strain Muguga]
MNDKDVETLIQNPPENTEFSKHETENSKNVESSPKFDPKMSSREMRKIKYYEDRFARMEDENKTSSSSLNMESGPSVHKTRTRVHDKRRSMDQKSYRLSSMDGYRHDAADSTYTRTGSRPGRKPGSKRTATSTSLNYSNNSKYDAVSTDVRATDKKTLLENRRLMRVQSMPTVTKKIRVVENHSTPDKAAPETPTHTRRNRVTRWDVKYVTKSSEEPQPTIEPPHEPPHVTKEEVVESDVPKEEQVVTELPEDALKPSLVQPVNSEESLKEMSERDIITPVSDLTDFSFDHDTKDLPLDVDEFLNEDDEQAQLPKVEELTEAIPEPVPEPLEPVKPEPEYVQYEYEEPVIQVPVKKKSNRGRKAKNRRGPAPAARIPEQPSDPDKSLLDDLTPAAASIDYQQEIVDEVKPPVRRAKSHRTRRKRQEYYEPERPVVSRGKHAKSRSHKGHAGASEKHDKSYSHSKSGELGDERFISIDKLRMITVEEAEKMINPCKKNDKDMENLKNAIRSLGLTESESLDHENESPKRNRFLLDPSNIVAPCVPLEQEKVEVEIPDDPLKLSFKYRLFHSLNRL